MADRSDSTVTWTGAGPNPGNESRHRAVARPVDGRLCPGSEARDRARPRWSRPESGRSGPSGGLHAGSAQIAERRRQRSSSRHRDRQRRLPRAVDRGGARGDRRRGRRRRRGGRSSRAAQIVALARPQEAARAAARWRAPGGGDAAAPGRVRSRRRQRARRQPRSDTGSARRWPGRWPGRRPCRSCVWVSRKPRNPIATIGTTTISRKKQCQAGAEAQWSPPAERQATLSLQNRDAVSQAASARGYSSVGRAPGSHPGGRGFESR